jgi:Rod binding domain-containing protein
MIQSNVDIAAINSQVAVSRMESLANSRASEKEIDKVASDFQTMCYASLVKSMFATTEDSAIWGEGHAAGLLRSMFIEAMANAGGAETLNIKASIKKSMYQSMGIEKEADVLQANAFEDLKQQESVNVML